MRKLQIHPYLWGRERRQRVETVGQRKAAVNFGRTERGSPSSSHGARATQPAASSGRGEARGGRSVTAVTAVGREAPAPGQGGHRARR